MEQKIYNSLEGAQKYFLSAYENIFLVSGRNTFEKSGAKNRLDSTLLKNCHHFYDFTPNPKLEEVTKGIKEYKKSNADLIIAVGGGTTMDMAKLIKGLARAEDPEKSIIRNEIMGAEAYLVAVPTTSGSGAESTPFAVVYVNGKKFSLQHNELLPDEIVLDSSLTYSLPSKQTAISGMDAFSQAIESYWSKDSTMESRQYSKEAIPMILKNLESAVNRPDNLNRGAMMKASNLAGKAIAISKTTACHAISYPITSLFGVPHGHAVALTLGEILEYNSLVDNSSCVDSRGADHVRNSLYEIQELLGVETSQEANIKIKRLMESIGLEIRLSEIGILDSRPILNGINIERLKNNPREINEVSLEIILGKIR